MCSAQTFAFLLSENNFMCLKDNSISTFCIFVTLGLESIYYAIMTEGVLECTESLLIV